MSTTTTGTGTTPLGDTGISVFPLCLGGNVFGWSADEEASRAVLDAFAEAGGNLVDTADVYSAWVDGHSGGESESVIGRWLADRRSSGSTGERAGGSAVHVATKTGMLEGADLSPASVDAALDASLGRLGTDSVALYYAHRDEEDRPVEEVVRAFAATVTDGRARAWAVSNWTAERIDAAVATAQEAGLPGPVAVQNAGSAVVRTDTAVVDACRRHGLLGMPYGALASGFLTGKYVRGEAPPESVRAAGVGRQHGDERSWAVLDAVRQVAEARGAEVSTVALAWLRAQGTVPIASARTPEQLPALLALTDVELSADEQRAITTAGL